MSSVFLISSVCTDLSALTLLSVQAVLGLCFTPISFQHPPSLCLQLPQTPHCAFVLLENPTRLSKSLCNSDMKANIKTCLYLL